MLFNFLSPPKVGGEYRGGFLLSGRSIFIHELKHLAIELRWQGLDVELVWNDQYYKMNNFVDFGVLTT